MRIEPAAVVGVMLISVEPHVDDRGLFARTYDAATFAAAGLPVNWPQCNVSWNRSRGTLRGMHYQRAPFEEPKLVRCTAGRIFDVAIDLRPDRRPIAAGWGSSYRVNGATRCSSRPVALIDPDPRGRS